jgi:hypothetical protein
VGFERGISNRDPKMKKSLPGLKIVHLADAKNPLREYAAVWRCAKLFPPAMRKGKVKR